MADSERTKMLISTVATLASKAELQLEHLEGQNCPECIDELALDFDAIAAAAHDMLNKGEISLTQYERVKSLDQYLVSMSGAAQEDLWTPNALRFAQQWENVRVLALECLQAFNLQF